MPLYAYKSITHSGAAVSDRIDATSEEQAKAILRLRGEHVISIREQTPNQLPSLPLARGKKASVDEVATTIRQLSILIRAGVPLVEGLTGLSEQARSPIFGKALEQITSDVSQGAALSESFEKHPAFFPRLAVEMARVAETGGNLAESLGKLAEHMEKGAEIVRKIKGALAYPLWFCVYRSSRCW